MRTYGRVSNQDGSKAWRVVTTDPSGDDSAVYLTTLCQVLLLNLGESPFYANYGLPAKQTIVQQVQPDFYVQRTQSQFSQFFSALLLTKQQSRPPTYKINVTTRQGAKVILEVPQ